MNQYGEPPRKYLDFGHQAWKSMAYGDHTGKKKTLFVFYYNMGRITLVRKMLI